MEILHFKDLGDTSQRMQLGINLPVVSHHFLVCSFRYFTSVYNLKAIRPLLMEILHFEDLGDTSVINECSLGVNLVIDNFFYVASGTSPLYKI